MVRDGKAPVSAEEVDELLELDILEPTEPDVWEMYHRGLIDKEKGGLSPVSIQTHTSAEKERTCQEAKTGSWVARDETEPDRHGIC